MYDSPHLRLTHLVLDPGGQPVDLLPLPHRPTLLVALRGAALLALGDAQLQLNQGQLFGPLPGPATLTAAGEEEAGILLVGCHGPEGEAPPLPATLLSLLAEDAPEALGALTRSLGIPLQLRLKRLPPGEMRSGTSEGGIVAYACLKGQGALRAQGQERPLTAHRPEVVTAGVYHQVRAETPLTLLALHEQGHALFFPTLGCGGRALRCSFSEALGQGLLWLDSAGAIKWASRQGAERLRLRPDSPPTNLLSLVDGEGQRWLTRGLSLPPEALPILQPLRLRGGERATAALFPYGSGLGAPEYLLVLGAPQGLGAPPPADLPESRALLVHLGLAPALQSLAPHPGWLIVWGEPGTGKEALALALHREGAWVRGPAHRLHIGGMTPAELGRALGRGLPGHLQCRVEANSGGMVLVEGFEDHTPADRVEHLKVLTDAASLPGAARMRLVCLMADQPHQGLPPTQSAAGLQRRGPFTLLRTPPLRELRERLPGLLHHLLASHRQGEPLRFTGEALERLRDHRWEGNLEELEALARGLAIQHVTGAVDLQALEPHLRGPRASEGDAEPIPTLFEAEGALIRRALLATGGNKVQAAKLLGLTRTRLYRKIAEHQLEMHT